MPFCESAIFVKKSRIRKQREWLTGRRHSRSTSRQQGDYWWHLTSCCRPSSSWYRPLPPPWWPRLRPRLTTSSSNSRAGWDHTRTTWWRERRWKRICRCRWACNRARFGADRVAGSLETERWCERSWTRWRWRTRPRRRWLGRPRASETAASCVVRSGRCRANGRRRRGAARTCTGKVTTWWSRASSTTAWCKPSGLLPTAACTPTIQILRWSNNKYGGCSRTTRSLSVTESAYRCLCVTTPPEIINQIQWVELSLNICIRRRTRWSVTTAPCTMMYKVPISFTDCPL